MSDTIRDPAQERRRLRAAQESMKQKRNLAAGGFVVASGCLYLSVGMPGLPDTVCWVMRIAAPVIFGVSALPFLRSPCPQCKQPYHALASLLRNPEHTLPCKSCGFQIDKHVSMY
ncbi:hypothetical protein [Dyella acidiphila]|uniref:Uncharacterized protein n=1 Tax=Dyella acidiphila TaxID=2775866 RepID=A0ABR9G9U7_9GAMM|nr:hypothetical protein [Dyella acidiphila]MBE1160797.1 hypothetical protein [Dyella acidiphila]